MDFRPKHLLAMAALAGGLAFGGATLASAQTADDGTTDTTVPAEDGTGTDDAAGTDDGTREDCPLGGDGAPEGSSTDTAVAS